MISNTTLIEKVYSNALSNVGFNGGIIYKNYYGAILVASFIGIFIYYSNYKKRKIDFVSLILIFCCLIMSNSKGGLLLLLLFVGLYFAIFKWKILDKFKVKEKKYNKVILVMLTILLMIILMILGYKYILSNSSTYAYRIRGVVNYISFYKNDLFHLMFGNSEMAFRDSEYSYVENIRIFLTQNGMNGYEGSYEMGFINVLIKNGIVGIIGFVFIYIIIIHRAKRRNLIEKQYIYMIILVLLVSSLVESYVCNIHAIFGISCYMFINGLLEIGKK